MRLLQLLRSLATVAQDSGPSKLLAQALLIRLLRRTPMGMLEMFLLRKLLAGDGRLFGMDLSARRQARLGWLARVIQKSSFRRKPS